MSRKIIALFILSYKDLLGHSVVIKEVIGVISKV